MNTEAPTTIKADHLTKSFNADFGKSYSALARILSKLHLHTEKRVVIHDVSFSARQGEIVGVIGRNGSGKSTLLRLLAKIYVQTSGTIFTEGKVVYLSPTGINLIQKLSMRDNIFYFGSILGMTQKDIRKLLPEIVEFSGLEEHIDSSVLHFSTGMVARLSFSVTYFCLKHTNPEIILLDEVFGSGADIDFEIKAIQKMEELIKSGMTVLLVSHNLEIMEKYCHKIMWLEDGRVKLIGMPKDIIEAYKTHDDYDSVVDIDALDKELKEYIK